jgi:hypothetical protein
VTVAIKVPADTSWPFLISSDAITPLTGAGTSIDAFSLSSVIKGSSARIVAPTVTSTSITVTCFESPRSGTRISTTLTAAPSHHSK